MILAKKVMKNFKKSLCALTVIVSVSGFATTAFAEDAPALQTPSVSSVPVPTSSANKTTDATSSAKDTKKSEKEIEKEKLEHLDYSNYNQEAVLRKVAVLQSMLQLKKLQKDILDVDKDDDNQNQNQNQNQGMPMGMQQPNIQPQTASQQTANSLTTPTVEVAPVIKATAVYSLGNTSYAEISYNGNKTVVKTGEVLPSGYKVTSLNPLGITLQKGKTKMSLPIVGDSPSASDAASIAQQNSSAVNNSSSVMPPPTFQMSAPTRK